MNRVQKTYQPSSRIERLAEPLARWRKPLIRVNVVFQEIDHQILWYKKTPSSFDKKIIVIHTPPQHTKTESGVSRAALKYEASENIRRLAKPRSIPKTDDEKCSSVKSSSLVYKPSLRILQLSKPRTRVVKT
ncbi:uncharacterized protein LOC112592300 [Melanaphis sacchari]|uniref:uncharacterized protein LOC112592300 n=1 Tax=Melanaphis sacchari TaxID=742174 RepID=UPI000DC1536E|nr:uncharacterized protein LOC112592300 [Melanaphis sacchari]